jgi:16S rRNA (uracil1498-N3)-methyltransferase
MHVFYQTDLSQNHIILSEDESKHCVRVLRLKNGDEVDLADGKGTHAKAIIVDDHPKKCVLQITQSTIHTQVESSGRDFYLHIVVAPTKNFDRMEWFIEKATEAGIDEITFIETENSERAKVNLERCEKIAVSAMKQSKQWYLPKINALQKIADFFKQDIQGAKFMAWCETDDTTLINKKINQLTSNHITILIGPEGDFTEAEVKLAQQHQFVPVSLGKTILRTETAALYACFTVKAILTN